MVDKKHGNIILAMIMSDLQMLEWPLRQTYSRMHVIRIVQSKVPTVHTWGEARLLQSTIFRTHRSK